MSKKLFFKIAVYCVLVIMGYVSFSFYGYTGALCFASGLVFGSQAGELLKIIHDLK